MSVSFATAFAGTLATSLLAMSAVTYGAELYNTLGKATAPNQPESLLAHRGSGRFEPMTDSTSVQTARV